MVKEAFLTTGKPAPKAAWSLHPFDHPRPQLWCTKCGAGPMWDRRPIAGPRSGGGDRGHHRYNAAVDYWLTKLDA